MEELYKSNLKGKKVAADGATSPHQEGNLSSQCDIQMEMMPSINSSSHMFGTLPHGMGGENLWNDPSDMYIDFGVLGNITGFEEYEETITTPREGEDPNNTPNEKDMQPFCYSLTE
ncbi:hypothetical protein CK203_022992 [Vitis vinifera]|uniref:Uncharacterized protein n=1 Tax=Vitis vinifera TaxID=29760 RepID=A0A438J4A2_VITVI|nr:hypothetical protein CK203_022992 [Vitis vinifera]